MKLSLFDLHADTAWAMLQSGQPLGSNSLAVSLDKAQKFDRYIQTMALWTTPKLSDEEGYVELLKIVKNLKSDPALQNGKAELCFSCPTRDSEKASLILSVEDARVLGGRIERVAELAEMGVKSVIPMWSGETCFGGSHNTEVGLTDFGKHAAKEMLSHGMVLDISHASVASSKDIFEISAACGKPVIASHSNAHAICPVSRNLHDWQIDAIVASGGVIGINLFRLFLEEDGNATLDSILRHVEYFLARGAENALALGCDMDGADLPDEIPNLSYLDRIAEHLLAHGYSQKLIDALFFENAYRFAQKHF
jgi:membrane dipeptidase